MRNAKKVYDQGVPEHPGPHVEGDPRWPTWIDWYGKVAGRITGGTGRRLQRIAGYAMLTEDPQVIQWTKELALEACKWDPNGGSAMRRGDPIRLAFICNFGIRRRFNMRGSSPGSFPKA